MFPRKHHCTRDPPASNFLQRQLPAEEWLTFPRRLLYLDATSTMESVLQAELHSLTESGLLRRARLVEARAGATIVVDGRRAIDFSSNDYLGLASHPALREAMARAAATEGSGAAASRLISGTRAPHRALEQRIARWKGTEAALLFNSGYQANVGAVSALAGPEDVVYSDALNHASLIDGCRLSRATTRVFAHADPAALEALLAADAGRFRRRLI